VLLDLLGDAYTQGHDLAKAEQAVPQGAGPGSVRAEPSARAGQTLLAEEKYAEALAVYQNFRI